MAGTPFGSDVYDIGSDAAGRALGLIPMSPKEAGELAQIFCRIDPWKKVKWPAARLENFLAGRSGNASRWVIHADSAMAGAVAVSSPWLHGAYLHFLGITPEFQNAAIGACVMRWLENEAIGNMKNLWICVSDFNEQAERFYTSFGFERAARLDDLVAPGFAEILLRKRL